MDFKEWLKLLALLPRFKGNSHMIKVFEQHYSYICIVNPTHKILHQSQELWRRNLQKWYIALHCPFIKVNISTVVSHCKQFSDTDSTTIFIFTKLSCPGPQMDIWYLSFNWLQCRMSRDSISNHPPSSRRPHRWKIEMFLENVKILLWLICELVCEILCCNKYL